MKKSLVWSAALLGVVLMLGAVSVSARSSKTLAQTGVGATTTYLAVLSGIPAQAATLSSSAVYKYKDKDGDGDNDKNNDKKKDHDPAPEPSTLLSFGAAILIGGGVLYSRRLRKSQ